eukprot:Nk52_evm32s295 gene=Nk52_evmTU32s295
MLTDEAPDMDMMDTREEESYHQNDTAGKVGGGKLVVDRSFEMEKRKWMDDFGRWNEEHRNAALVDLVKICKKSQLMTLLGEVQPHLQRDFIALLPEELSVQILSFLDVKSLCSSGLVSHQWRNISRDNLLWKNMCIKDNVFTGNEIGTAMTSANRTWKKTYVKDYLTGKNWQNGEFSLTTSEGHKNHVITCLQADDKYTITGSDDSTLRVLHSDTNELMYTLDGHLGGVWSCEFEGDTLVSGSTDRTLKVWDLKTGDCLQTLRGHTSTVRCISLHGGIVVSGSRDNLIKVWDIGTGECLHTLRGHTQAVRCIEYDGSKIVSGSYDHTVRTWDPNGYAVHVLVGHTEKIYSLAVEGNVIVSGSLDTTIRVWGADTGLCVHVLQGHKSLVGLLRLSGQYLASGNADTSVKIWNVVTGDLVNTLQAHESAVTSLQFDETKVVSGSDDGTVILWDFKTGRMLHRLVNLGFSGVVWRLQYSRDKVVAAVGGRGEDGTLEAMLHILDFSVMPSDRRLMF